MCLGLEICPIQAYITRDSFSYCRMHIHYVNKQYSFTGHRLYYFFHTLVLKLNAFFCSFIGVLKC